jgi:glutaredoxin
MEEKIKTFIKKSIQIHGDKYDYSKIKEIKSRKKIEVLCKIHGSFLISPDNHIFQKSGCPRCSRDRHKLTKISPERLEKIKSVHNNKYAYKNLSISNGFISITCLTHGEFSQRIYNHENGHGCNKCYLESKNTKESIEKKRTCKSCKEQLLLNEFNSKFKICKSCQENPIIPSYKICIHCKNEKLLKEFQPRPEQWLSLIHISEPTRPCH